MRMRPLAMVFLAAGLLSNPALAQQQPDPDSPDSDTSQQLYELGRFAAVYQRVLANYVDKPAPEKLIKAAIDGMIGSLDPHSRYVDAQAFEAMQTELTGRFAGLGVEVFVDRDDIKVRRTLPDSPAAKAGLKPDDIILKLDGTMMRGHSLGDVLERMQGPAGTSAALVIERQGVAEPVTLILIRAILEVETVRYQRLGQDVGYIRITEFDDQTFDALHEAMLSLRGDEAADLRGFIVDLRNNPGGLLDQAIVVSAAFLGKGVVTTIRGRSSTQGKVFVANGRDLVGGKPLIVLINGGTASAAEIVAGALQDLRRATILGTRSFGKGSVQTVARLADQSALILTTARYYTPLGRSIQAEGIEPDILVLQHDRAAFSASHTSVGEAGLAGHLKSQSGQAEGGGSSVYVPVDMKDDTQLNAAVDLLRGIRTDPAFPPRRVEH